MALKLGSFGHFQQTLETVETDVRRGFWRTHYEPNGDGTFRYRHGDLVICSVRGCRQHATHMSEYRYVTGRRGNVSRREMSHCTKHAAEFRVKYGLAKLTERA